MLLYVDSRFLSPYALSAFVALTEKGLAFRLRPLDLAAGEGRADDYAQASLTQRVPALADGDFTVAESSAIAEYLEDLHPEPPIFPADARQRARARQVQAWLRSDLAPLRQERPTEVVFHRAAAGPLSPAAQAAAGRLFRAAGELLAHGRDHLFGDWCIADVDLALMLNRLAFHGDEVPAPLARYAARQWERPSVQRWAEKSRPPR